MLHSVFKIGLWLHISSNLQISENFLSYFPLKVENLCFKTIFFKFYYQLIVIKYIIFACEIICWVTKTPRVCGIIPKPWSPVSLYVSMKRIIWISILAMTVRTISICKSDYFIPIIQLPLHMIILDIKYWLSAKLIRTVPVSGVASFYVSINSIILSEYLTFSEEQPVHNKMAIYLLVSL